MRASSASSVAASSFTPRSSTDWLTIGMPASTMRAQAARDSGRQFARMIGVQRDVGRLRRELFIARTSAGVILFGSDDRQARVQADDLHMPDGGDAFA